MARTVEARLPPSKFKLPRHAAALRRIAFPSTFPAVRAPLLPLYSLFLALAASFAGSAADWPRFLGPTADGRSPETGLLDAWPAQGPPVVWEKKTGTGYSAPSILGDRLVLHHRLGDEEVVECFAAGDGRPLWRHADPTAFVDPYGYNNGPRASPLLTTNRCYTFGAEGRLVCLDLATGARIWSRDTGREWDVPEAFFGVGSSPVLHGDTLLVMVGGQPDAGMVGLDAATGRTRWESVGQRNWNGAPMLGWPGDRRVVWRASDKQASYATPVLAPMHGETLAFCLMRQGLVALDPATGAVRFQRWFRAQVEESVNAANPIVTGDLVFFSAAYYKVGSVCLRVHPDNREYDEAWRSPVLELHWSTPLLIDGQLYGFSGRNEPDARFRCVDLTTGRLRWDRDESWAHRSGGQPPVYGRGSAILAEGKLIVLGEGGLLGLFRVDPEKPDERSRWQVPGLHYPCWAGPVLSGRRLYLRSEDRLICLDLKAAGTSAAPPAP